MQIYFINFGYPCFISGKTAGDNEMLKKKRMQQIRKGQVGDSKNHFNEQELEEWTKWMNENAEKFGVQLPE